VPTRGHIGRRGQAELHADGVLKRVATRERKRVFRVSDGTRMNAGPAGHRYLRTTAASQATTRYTWKTSAYSRFTLTPCVLATLQM
jgi:hypothetical protein